MLDQKIILGIDPGLSGSLAFIKGNELLEIIDIESYDSRINAHHLSASIRKYYPDLAICELVGAMPGQGVTSMFSFGHCLGAITGVLAALGVPTSFVRPAAWQKHYDIKTASSDKKGHKQEIADIAQSKYPSAVLTGPRGGLRDGRSDALLIASFLSTVGPESLIPKPAKRKPAKRKKVTGPTVAEKNALSLYKKACKTDTIANC